MSLLLNGSFSSIIKRVRKFWEKRLLTLSCLSVPAWNKSAPSGRIFMKSESYIFFENLSGKFKIQYNPAIITGNLSEDQHTFVTISRWVILRERNISDKSVEKIKTHIQHI